MLFFTSDLHFGTDSKEILEREMRPYNTPDEYAKHQIMIWNSQATPEDTIYIIGDLCNYNKKEKDWMKGLESIRFVNAPVILIIGNNEERVINEIFNGDFAAFRSFCIDKGFQDVKRDEYLCFGDTGFYLNHFPRNHKENYINLFGHTHRTTGIWKPYGLNVGTDLNHFRLYSQNDILYLLQIKSKWWDKDVDNNCM